MIGKPLGSKGRNSTTEKHKDCTKHSTVPALWRPHMQQLCAAMSDSWKSSNGTAGKTLPTESAHRLLHMAQL